MIVDYLYLKLLHIFVAVVALGTSAGLGIMLEFYGDDPAHGPFVLRAIERLLALVVLPGYVLMLASGLWMASLAWSFTAIWIRVALGGVMGRGHRGTGVVTRGRSKTTTA